MKKLFLSNSKCFYILILLTFETVFLQSKCNGQFHWGKNYKLEAELLRDMFARVEAQRYLTTTPKVGIVTMQRKYKSIYFDQFAFLGVIFSIQFGLIIIQTPPLFFLACCRGGQRKKDAYTESSFKKPTVLSSTGIHRISIGKQQEAC